MHHHTPGAGHAGAAFATRVATPSDALRAHGLRSTRARLLVLAALREAEHPTAEAVHKATSPEGIVLTTVYRTLESLEQVGLVWAVQVPGTGRTYHLSSQRPHAHLLCRVCGRLADLDPLPAEAWTTCGVPPDFAVEHVQLTVIGHCGGCAATSSSVGSSPESDEAPGRAETPAIPDAADVD